MSRLVAGIIDAARDRSVSFDPKRQPNGPLYRYLAEYCQRLQGKILAISPAYSGFETTLTYQMPLADFDAGLSLGTTQLVSEVLAVDPSPSGGTTPILLISREQRHAPNAPRIAAWQEGDRLYLLGPSSRWQNFAGLIEVRLIVPFGDVQVSALASPDALLPLPDTCALAAIEALAAFMGRRASPPEDLSAVAAQAESDALVAVSQKLIGTTFFTADEWQP